MRWQLLDDLSEEERRQLLARMQRRRFGRGDVLFHEGDPADTLHVVAEGRVLALRTTPLGDSAAFRVIGPGRALGDVAVAASDPRRSSTVVALEPTVTLAMSFAEFRHLVADHPQVLERLATLLSARVRRLTEHLVEALYLPSDRRVVNRLVDLCAEYGASADPPVSPISPGSAGLADSAGATPAAPARVVIPLTQTDLSQLAGAARPTTNRVLRALEREGLVKLSRGRIEVLDVVALTQRRVAV